MGCGSGLNTLGGVWPARVRTPQAPPVQPSPVLCPASPGMSISHIETCRNFERTRPKVHYIQRHTFGLGGRPSSRVRNREKSEICTGGLRNSCFASGPNNFSATKACLQLPCDIQSDPIRKHNLLAEKKRKFRIVILLLITRGKKRCTIRLF